MSSSTYQKDPIQSAALVGSQTTEYVLKAHGVEFPILITTSQLHTGHLSLVSHMTPSMKSGTLVCLM